MRNIEIKVNKESRKTELSKSVIGNDAENLQGNLVFTFPSDYDPDKTGIENEFVDGIARLEYTIDGEDYYVPNLTKQDETYIVPIKSVMTKKGQVYMQLVITEGTDPNEIPIFKSNVFYVIVNKSINAEIEQPDEFPTWEELFNVYIAQVETLDLDATKSGETTEVVITKKDGTEKIVNIDDGTGLNYNWVGTSLGVKREDEEEYVYTNLKGDKGDAGSVKFEIVQQLPSTGIEDDIIYLVPYEIITVQELPSVGLANTIYIVESTNKKYVYESGQWIEITSDNKYIEYIYVNNQWEELGRISVEIDLTDYYTKQEVNALIPDVSDFITKDVNNLTYYYTKTEINNMIGDISSAIDLINGESV